MIFTLQLFLLFVFLSFFVFIYKIPQKISKKNLKKHSTAELQRQQQHFVAQKLLSAQKHVAVTHPPQPQQATIVYRSQQQQPPQQSQNVPSQIIDHTQSPTSKGEVRHRSRSGRHQDARYTSGKVLFCVFLTHSCYVSE